MRIEQAEIWKLVLNGRVQRAVDLNSPVLDPQASLRRGVAYCEPRLSGRSGHFFKLSKCYRDLFETLGLPCAILHSLQASSNMGAEWIPYFAVPDHTMACRPIENQEELNRVQHYFHYQFERIIDCLTPRIFLLPSARFTNILSAVETIIGTGKQPDQSAIFGVLETEKVPDCTSENLVFSAFSRSAYKLERSDVRYIIMAENQKIKEFLVMAGFAPAKVHTFPYVASGMLKPRSTSYDGNDKTINVGYLGGTRDVKNPGVVIDVVTTKMLPQSIKWHIQVDLNYIRQIRNDKIEKKILKLQSKGVVKLYNTNLHEDEYEILLKSLDIVVLPYGTRYQDISSGIFLEAITTKVIPIVPKWSTMYTLYSELGGKAPPFFEMEHVSVRNVIENTLCQIKELRENAANVRENWLCHPSGFEAWKNALSEFIGQDLQ